MRAFIRKVLSSTMGKPVYFAYDFWTLLNERLLNIETGHSSSGPGARQTLPNDRGLYTEKAINNDNVYYEAINYYHIRRMMRILNPASDDIFYDIGCGKGRVLCVAARRRLKRVVGIELFEELCAAARVNAGRLRKRRTPIDVICADATTVDYSRGTIFSMFNPFGEVTMNAVIGNLRKSFHDYPRQIRIGYYMPVCEHILDNESWLERYASFNTVSYSVVFWRSRAIQEKQFG